VAAAEAALESAPAPTVPVVPEAPAVEAAAAPEPVPAPTPPAEPAEVPASVPSPAASLPPAAIAPAAETPAVEAPAAETAEAPAAETPAADAATAEAPASEAAAEQVASAEAPEETVPDTSGAAVLPAGAIRIVFEGDSDDLPQGASGELDAIANKMLTDETIKIQVLAYSSGTADAESQARRKALARGLEVRKYLIGKGVRSNRIDVRALGTKSEGSPADRVDIVPSAG
jgi:outer membrane protein OmpA-like peptidoglycan-associated protein